MEYPVSESIEVPDAEADTIESFCLIVAALREAVRVLGECQDLCAKRFADTGRMKSTGDEGIFKDASKCVIWFYGKSCGSDVQSRCWYECASSSRMENRNKSASPEYRPRPSWQPPLVLSISVRQQRLPSSRWRPFRLSCAWIIFATILVFDLGNLLYLIFLNAKFPIAYILSLAHIAVFI